MTEIQEVAESIWRARSSLEGNGQNVTMPIRKYADSEFVAAHYVGDQGATIRAGVAEELWRLAGGDRRGGPAGG